MRAIIENTIVYKQNASEVLSEFNGIIDCITNAPNEDFLRFKINKRSYNHFLIGFGGHHMWTKQLVNNKPTKRILFVEF